MSDWRGEYQKRLSTAEEAVARVRPGDVVNVPIFPPRALCDALWRRRGELDGEAVRLQLNASTHDPGWLSATPNALPFELDFEIFVGDFARPAHDERRG